MNSRPPHHERGIEASVAPKSQFFGKVARGTFLGIYGGYMGVYRDL